MKERIEKDINDIATIAMHALDVIYYNNPYETPERLKSYYYRSLNEALTRLFDAFKVETLSKQQYDKLFTSDFKFFYSTNIALEISEKAQELHSNESLFKRIFIRPFLNRLSFSNKIIDDIAKGVVPTLSLNELLVWKIGVESRYPNLTDEALEFVSKAKHNENYFYNLFENDPLLNSDRYKPGTKEGIKNLFIERDIWVKKCCKKTDTNKDFADNYHVNKYVGNLSEYGRDVKYLDQ
jgi:hypothetical protein